MGRGGFGIATWGRRRDFIFILATKRYQLNQEIFESRIAEFSRLGGGFKYFLFSPLFGEDSHFD